mgnify:CR=1 FL=1
MRKRLGRGVDLAPLQPANCGFDVDWSQHLATRLPQGHQHRPLLGAQFNGLTGARHMPGGGVDGHDVRLTGAPGRGEVIVRLRTAQGEQPVVRLGRDFMVDGELAERLASMEGIANVALSARRGSTRLRLVA